MRHEGLPGPRATVRVLRHLSVVLVTACACGLVQGVTCYAVIEWLGLRDPYWWADDPKYAGAPQAARELVSAIVGVASGIVALGWVAGYGLVGAVVVRPPGWFLWSMLWAVASGTMAGLLFADPPRVVTERGLLGLGVALGAASAALTWGVPRLVLWRVRRSEARAG